MMMYKFDCIFRNKIAFLNEENFYEIRNINYQINYDQRFLIRYDKFKYLFNQKDLKEKVESLNESGDKNQFL
jgi:hypothetical protein